MRRSVLDAMLTPAVGLVVGALIWTVADVVYDKPAAAAQEPGPVCPRDGVRVTAGRVEAALGLRAMDLRLENCGSHVYRAKGYPGLRLLDRDQQTITGISVIHGSGGIATVAAFDEPPKAVTLAPGETASAGLLWRNTTTGFDGATDVPYLTVEARPGALPLLVAPDGGLDLGTTGRLGVSPWHTTTGDGGTR
ncbi:DUF4232 domain-containing protein [Streptomyces sp. NPDC092369]|uniref:DUF4232 domain-containing protein n=1 Tax=Streptomyces sp. NPDC092369 TaxID=3366015 RepID=UPI00382ABA88